MHEFTPGKHQLLSKTLTAHLRVGCFCKGHHNSSGQVSSKKAYFKTPTIKQKPESSSNTALSGKTKTTYPTNIVYQ